MTGAIVAAAVGTVAILVLPWSARSPGLLLVRPPGTELWAAGRRGRRARQARTEAVTEALRVLDAVAPALRAGLPASTALAHLAATSAGRGGLAADLAAAASTARGLGVRPARASPIGAVWWHAAQRSGADELQLAGAAWTLADVSGVALADAVDLAARLLRESRSRQTRLDVLLAGPRATMSLLTVLPLAGPVVGLMFGIAPLTLYAGSPLCLLSAGCGIGLLFVGRLWCRGLLRSALSAGSSARSIGARAVAGERTTTQLPQSGFS